VTLALALAKNAAKDPALGDELAATMDSVGPFSGEYLVKSRVRRLLAEQADDVEKELLVGSGDDHWTPARVRGLIERVKTAKTPYEKFVVAGSGLTVERLQTELARTLLAEGKYAEALAAGPDTAPLGTDPFVMHIRDCHDCDHEKYARAPWNLRNLLERLVALEKTARGTGEAAAQAAYELGSVTYNLTWYGNARAVLGAHAATEDTAPAEAWFARAFELTQQRELKAKAAYMAAKCELPRLPGAQEGSPPRAPRWYGSLAKFADTAYHREVLAECGYYQDWRNHGGR
jgi:hypothetical protein